MRYFILIFFAMTTGSAHAATINLKNGDRLTGKITAYDQDRVTIHHTILGEINLYTSDIANMSELMPDVTTIIEDVEEQGKWIGTTRLGANIVDGTSNSSSYAFAGKIRYEKRKNRYSLDSSYSYAEANSLATTDNLNARAQYDRFFSEKWYGFGNSSYFSDKIAQINRRLSLGGGMGYQFFNTSTRQLKIELGLSQVHESRPEGTLNYPGSRWLVDYEEHIWRDKLILFHNQEGFLNLGEYENVTVRSRNGLKLPLLQSIYTAAQVDVDFNGNPAAGTEYLTTRYILALGYDW